MIKILLVEDDKYIVANLTEFLASEGYSVKSASGQMQALKLLENESFNLALLDISLSGGNGYAVCSAIKASYGIPVIRGVKYGNAKRKLYKLMWY